MIVLLIFSIKYDHLFLVSLSTRGDQLENSPLQFLNQQNDFLVDMSQMNACHDQI